MDNLDSKKVIRQRIVLFTGYILVAIAIAMATLVLLYQAYGFGLGKNGSVIQNGLLFFSSQPNPANIYINSKLSSQTTDTRLIIPSGIYQIMLTRSGYRDWSRRVTVIGGQVEHFDYPLLIPDKLSPKTIGTYSSAPGLMTQSPSRRYLLVEKPGNPSEFDLYDFANPATPVITTVSLPSGLLPSATTSQSWQLVGWADDNQHVLLKYLYDNSVDYILVDTINPSQSVDLSTSLTLTGTTVTLDNEKYNNYYIYNNSTDELDTATLGSSTLTPVLEHVLAYKSYGNNTILYVTPDNNNPDKVLVKLSTGNQLYNITSLPVSSNYLVNLTTYSGTLYVAVGTSSGDSVYIYQDPVGQLSANPGQSLVPSWVLHVDQPNYLSFSDNAQFIMTENGYHYAVYDIENQLGYLYSDSKYPLDSPQTSATWMDGDRLAYVSGGKLMIQDYDNANHQTLVSADSSFLPAFSPNYNYVITMTDSTTAAGQYDIDITPLLTPAEI